uniref:40S ribosomal protein S19 n=1 Tax=Placozoa sp. H4 TaxID=1034858 RepID=M4T843_9METZ|nr:40S ribosomal protein S19 [Placozoa sp. H4]
MSAGGATVKDVNPHDFVKAFAAFLKKSGKLNIPDHVDLAKTNISKELAPYDPDWYYIRAAAVARRIYLQGGQGVGRIRRKYGASKRRGSRPCHYSPGIGGVTRAVLRSLEGMKIIQKVADANGRYITSTGQRDLDRIAAQVAQKKSA